MISDTLHADNSLKKIQFQVDLRSCSYPFKS